MSDQERVAELRQAGLSRTAIAAVLGTSVEEIHAAGVGEGALPVASGPGRFNGGVVLEEDLTVPAASFPAGANLGGPISLEADHTYEIVGYMRGDTPGPLVEIYFTGADAWAMGFGDMDQDPASGLPGWFPFAAAGPFEQMFRDISHARSDTELQLKVRVTAADGSASADPLTVARLSIAVIDVTPATA